MKEDILEEALVNLAESFVIAGATVAAIVGLANLYVNWSMQKYNRDAELFIEAVDASKTWPELFERMEKKKDIIRKEFKGKWWLMPCEWEKQEKKARRRS